MPTVFANFHMEKCQFVGVAFEDLTACVRKILDCVAHLKDKNTRKHYQNKNENLPVQLTTLIQ